MRAWIPVASAAVFLILAGGCGKEPEQKATPAAKPAPQVAEKAPSSTPEPQQEPAPAEPPDAEPEAAPEPPGAEAETAEGEGGDVPEGMAVVAIALPEPMFQGTPKPVNEPNIEEPLGKPRPPFLAPDGTENLALGKPVTSSDDWPIIGEVDLITDGDKAATAGSFVELGPGTQWVQIDLGRNCRIFGIVVWHFHAQARAYRDVVVQLAGDPDLIMDVTTIFNNDHDNSSGLGVGEEKGYVETFEGKLIDANGAEGRYLRLYSNGNTSDDGNHYIEVEVYGLPAE
jgi:hypothetical protein